MQTARREVFPVSSIFPSKKKKPEESKTRSSVTLTDALWARLEEPLREERDEDGRKFTRDSLIEHLLRVVLDQYEAEKKQKR